MNDDDLDVLYQALKSNDLHHYDYVLTGTIKDSIHYSLSAYVDSLQISIYFFISRLNQTYLNAKITMTCS